MPEFTQHSQVEISNFSSSYNVSLSRSTFSPLGHTNVLLDVTYVKSERGMRPLDEDAPGVKFGSIMQSQPNMLDNQHRIDLAHRTRLPASIATKQPFLACVLALSYPKPALSALRLA